MSDTMKMTRAARRRYKKGERPGDPMDRLILGITFAINDEVTVQNVTDIAQSIVVKAGSMERAIEIVESGKLSFENMGPVGNDFRYLTFDQMAKGAGTSVDRAIKEFDALEDKGVIIVEKRDEHGALFAINFDAELPLPQVH